MGFSISKNPASFFFFFAGFFLLSSISIAFGAEGEFSYFEGSGKGPKEWGKLKPEWKSCEKGKLQSPINIVEADVQRLPDQLQNLQMDYKPALALLQNRGHDITVSWKGDAGKITINGIHYKLIQCHWHTPSEHSFNGTRHAMEMHIVHMTDQNQIAVIGILYKYGRRDPFLSKFVDHVKSIGTEVKEIGIVNPADIMFGSRKYYRYIGSLTVPPCTEGVIWTLLKEVRTVSRQQVKALENALHDVLKKNARPTQPLEGRRVQFYTPSK